MKYNDFILAYKYDVSILKNYKLYFFLTKVKNGIYSSLKRTSNALSGEAVAKSHLRANVSPG